MSRSVWVIEKGQYSDYQVVGVYSTRENAERVVAKLLGGRDAASDDPSVSEWELDPGVEALNQGLSKYLVIMQHDGTVERAELVEWDMPSLETEVRIWRRTKAPAYAGRGIPDALEGWVYARDEKHAIKIANEKRVQMIASGEWPGPTEQEVR